MVGPPATRHRGSNIAYILHRVFARPGGKKKFKKHFFPSCTLKVKSLQRPPQSEIFPFFCALVPLLFTPERSLKPRKQMLEICEVEKGSVVESITNFSVRFHSLSLLGSMQVAKAPCCAQSCSVLSVPAKEELLPLHLCLCVCVCGERGEGVEMKTSGCTLQPSATT